MNPYFKKSKLLKIGVFLIIFLIIIGGVIIILKKPKVTILVGTGNPGEIRVFSVKNLFGLEKSLQISRILETGFQFVHTVFKGDIYNNGQEEIIVGASNSLYKKPYGCQVLIFDKDAIKPKILDDVGDLRCKDVVIGDAYNNGKNSVILGTHGQGIINVYTWDSSTAKWQKDEVEKNFIGKIDQLEGTDHSIGEGNNFENPFYLQNAEYPGVIQAAIHNVRVGDIYNNGKNVIVATISSPLEYYKTEEISFIKSYCWTGDRWEDKIIDRINGLEFRSIATGKIKGDKNALVIGTGTRSANSNAKLFLYEWNDKDGRFDKTLLYESDKETNMKGLDIDDLDGDGQNEIALVSSQFQGSLRIFKWNGGKQSFDVTDVDNLNKTLALPDDFGLNVMSTKIKDVDGDGKAEIEVGGLIVSMPHKQRWEESQEGFLIIYRNNNGIWGKQFFDNLPAVLASYSINY